MGSGGMQLGKENAWTGRAYLALGFRVDFPHSGLWDSSVVLKEK
jgi:hypothetical protein